MKPMSSFVSLAALVLGALAALPVRAQDAPTVLHLPASSGKAFLGVRLSDLDDEEASELGLGGGRGVLVEQVIEDSAAAEAGLEDGDILLGFDGERVRSAAHLGRLVRETAPGRSVALLVQRDGRERELRATLKEREQAGSYLFAPSPSMPALPALPPGVHFDADALRDALGLAGGPSWRLGIVGDDLSSQLAAFFEVDQGAGVLIEEVLPGSSAERAGLRAGDVLVGLDDTRIRALGQLRELLGDSDRDAAASVVIVRKGRERSLPVELERLERPPVPSFGDTMQLREQAEAWKEQAEAWREQQREQRRAMEEQTRELRQQQRELQREQRERMRELGQEQREQQRELQRREGGTGVWWVAPDRLFPPDRVVEPARMPAPVREPKAIVAPEDPSAPESPPAPDRPRPARGLPL